MIEKVSSPVRVEESKEIENKRSNPKVKHNSEQQLNLHALELCENP